MPGLGSCVIEVGSDCSFTIKEGPVIKPFTGKSRQVGIVQDSRKDPTFGETGKYVCRDDVFINLCLCIGHETITEAKLHFRIFYRDLTRRTDNDVALVLCTGKLRQAGV